MSWLCEQGRVIWVRYAASRRDRNRRHRIVTNESTDVRATDCLRNAQNQDARISYALYLF